MSAILDDAIRAALNGVRLVHSHDTLQNGAVRVATTLKTLDNHHVDVFLCPPDGSLGVLLSDYGGTVIDLSNCGLVAWEDDAVMEKALFICEAFGVEYDRGELQTRAATAEEVPAAMLRLAQACVLVAGLSVLSLTG